jgi:hypothetical protein
MTLLWSDGVDDEHTSTCPAWGPRPIFEWQFPSFAHHGDPWRDVKWS